MDVCFMCTKDYNCVPVDNRIVSEVEYLIPEITIIKLGIPLHICSVCEGALDAFSKFKHSSVESSRRLESSIRVRGAPGPPLHTGRAPVVGHNDTSDTQPEKIEAVYIKEEPVEETWPEYHPHINSASLNPALRVDRTSPHVQLRALHTDISIKEEQLEQTRQVGELYNNIMKNICKEEYAESNTMSDDKDKREHKTEEENSRADTREEVWEKSSAEPEEIVKETHKNNQIETQKKNFKYRSNINNKLFIRKTNLSSLKKTIRGQKGRETELKSHSTEQESIRINNTWTCSECRKVFKYKSELDQHLKIHSEFREFTCEICTKSFRHKTNLIRHKKIHSGIKDFQCMICDKSFSWSSSLRAHMQIHSEFREFPCEICSISFKHKSNLVRHMKVHSGVKEFHCKICSKSFRWSSNLRSHMQLHSDCKQFQCEICHKSFAQITALTAHRKIHSDVRDFQCNICSKTFKRNSILRMHMKVHSDVKDFQCMICQMMFRYKNSLLNHMKTHS